MSYDELCDYLRRLEELSAANDIRIDWNVIKPDQVEALTAGKRMGLQIADAIASSFFNAVEPNQFGHTEDRYARTMKPVVYNYKNRYLGYGVKLWPKEVADGLAGDAHLAWTEAYK